MADAQTLKNLIEQHLASFQVTTCIALNQVTIEVPKQHIRAVCLILRDHPEFHFEQLMDLCGVDYSTYGQDEWATEETTLTGFSRAVERESQKQQSHYVTWEKPRFAVVYHLLSVKHNHRIRIRAFVEEKDLLIDSVVDIWSVANFFEREAFDLFGILFKGHPDLRRVLTDYGFIGHPFRKDFPLSGYVEPRYDKELERVVNEPVDIEPRVLVPRVIRQDNRYVAETSNLAAKPEK